MPRGRKQSQAKSDMNLQYISETQTLVGTKYVTLTNEETKETQVYQHTVKRIYGTKHFWKCYLKNLLETMEPIKSKELNVWRYIVGNIRSTDNMFIGSYQQIADATKTSRQTVASVIKILKEKKFMVFVQNGIWMINPDMLLKGNDFKHQELKKQFTEIYEGGSKVPGLIKPITYKVTADENQAIETLLAFLRTPEQFNPKWMIMIKKYLGEPLNTLARIYNLNPDQLDMLWLAVTAAENKDIDSIAYITFIIKLIPKIDVTNQYWIQYFIADEILDNYKNGCFDLNKSSS